MKNIYKTFWARQIAFGIYGFLAISIFFLHNIENTYITMNKSIDMVMETRLTDNTISSIAIVRPSKKPVNGQFDLASM